MGTHSTSEKTGLNGSDVFLCYDCSACHICSVGARHFLASVTEARDEANLTHDIYFIRLTICRRHDIFASQGSSSEEGSQLISTHRSQICFSRCVSHTIARISQTIRNHVWIERLSFFDLVLNECPILGTVRILTRLCPRSVRGIFSGYSCIQTFANLHILYCKPCL